MQEQNLYFLTRQRDGKIYYAEQEQDHMSCNGCVFNKPDGTDYNFCSCVDSAMTEGCYSKQIVWKEKQAILEDTMKGEEPKFTVEQVLAATGKHCDEKGPVFISFNETNPTAVAWIKQYLTQQQDPDYLLYLQLKAKYDQA